MTTPRPRAVVIGSLSLFAVLFVVLTFELSASASTSKGTPNTKATAVKARPAPTESSTDAAPESEETPSEYAEPEEAESEYVEPESEYVEPEPEYEEPEYVEPEVEETPPVVTSSS
jgi:hypothetical protein